MKKIRLFLALAVMAGAMNTVLAAGSDVVVLMDSSGTILPYFDEINNRILVDITRKFIRQGDTFHLVSFNSRVNLEIVQPILTEADVSRVVSRFMLLYPLGQNSDFLSGLQFTWQYVSSLDQQREKIIIVISDGIFNPPASSPYASYLPEQVRSEITLVSRRIRGAGWNVYYIKLPFPSNSEIRTLDGELISTTAASSDGTNPVGNEGAVKKYTDISSDFTDALDIEQSKLPETDVPLTFIDSVFSMPEVTFPQNLGRKGRFFILPLKVKNISDAPINMELTGVQLGDVNVLGKNSFLNLSPGARGTLRAEINLPETVLKGPQDLPIRLLFSNNLRVMPQAATVHITVTGFSPSLLFRTGGSVAVAIILILLALIAVAALFMFIFHRTARPASDAIRAGGASRESNGSREANAAIEATEKSERLEQIRILQSAKAPRPAQLAAAAHADKQIRFEAESRHYPIAETAPVDKQIHYVQEKKSYPIATATAKDGTAAKNVSDLAALQAAEKSERLAILAEAAKKPEHRASRISGANANDHIAVLENSRIMLELHVNNQNPNVGKRNIHMMKAGSRLSLGGGTSSFLVFLVKFPSNIAEIRYDGKECSLAILKPDYFPYETSNIVTDCLNREFTIMSDKSYELTFTVRNYENPVLTLNRLLTSIKY